HAPAQLRAGRRRLTRSVQARHHPAVLRPAGLARLAAARLTGTVHDGLDARAVDTVADEVAAHGRRPALGERLVRWRRAPIVRVALPHHTAALVGAEPRR